MSHDINQKFDLLISCLESPRDVSHSPFAQLLEYEDGGHYFFKTCGVDEEVVVTFNEFLTAFQQEGAQKSRMSETRMQLKHRKLTVAYHISMLNVLTASWKYPGMNLIQLIHFC